MKTKNLTKPEPTLDTERALILSGTQLIAGADETGVGAMAGPVVAAAVMLPLPAAYPDLDLQLTRLSVALDGVRDSNQARRHQHEQLFELIHTLAAPHIGVAVIEVAELAAIANQTEAGRLATIRAIQALPALPEHVLTDGPVAIAELGIPFQAVAKVRGVTPSLSIAAASIISTVTFRRIMTEYGQRWPAYGFERHGGHSSPAHLEALARYGPSPVHHPHSQVVALFTAGDGDDLQARNGSVSGSS